ncbi:MAG TPA: helix-turn-helix domain-containing protein [Bryobacteraceae bacterium]|nr:helix-turn-helix domain-containing protein [Bryobacteraceae bacterium]
MHRQTRPPSPFLQDYVSHFELRDLVVLEARGIRPLPARSAHFLVFHLADVSGSDLLDRRTGKIVATPPVGIQGPQSFRAADALWKGRFRDFAVAFRPTGFYRLFGTPMNELTDQVVEALQLLGAGVRQLHESLQGVAGLDTMALLTEDFLRGWLPRARPFHPVQVAASQVIARHGQVTVDHLARALNLSGRQLERGFLEQVGIPPKLYCRISRLTYALRLKEATPQRTWTELTYLAGYFDQNHMIKDFRALAGTSPSEFVRLIENGFKPGRSLDIAGTSVSY